jgi:polyisoprenoid-binding protein YceI
VKRFAPFILLAFLTIVPHAASPAESRPVVWTPDLVHSRVEFTVAHMVVSKVWGHISIARMSVVTEPGSPIPTQLSATLDPARLDTDNHTRDADLRSSTYFDVGAYPTITFASRKIVPKGPMDYIVTGDLTVRNVTRSETIPMHVVGIVPDPDGSRVGYTGTLDVDRRDFGITDNRLMSGVLFVGYHVNIVLTVEATTSAPMPHRT